MATFPEYAKILFEGYSINRESALLRTEMDSGPPRQAKIKSKVMVTHNVNIYLSSKQNLSNFEVWYQDDINFGASWFTMNHPVLSETTIQARFVGGGYTLTPMSADMNNWKLSAKIEEIGWTS